MTEHVISELNGGVLTLTLNRPEKKNALTRDMYAALGGGIDKASADPAIRCVLIQANGDAFTAGNDLSDFSAANRGEPAAAAQREEGNPLLAALGRATVPIVAAVHGRAVGVGVTMLLHCDQVFVAEDALLSTPFVNLALVPEAASSLLLPARIGHARAFSMFALGEVVDGKTAAAWGIANTALPVADLRAKARAVADLIASRPASAVSATKVLMRDMEAIAQAMTREGSVFAAQLKSPEAREAFAAFAERRAPNFSKVA